ncbi:MAG: hypothetical protein OK422_00155 [Thaumarchaeota archaeon]|nr:hypothetical protein [Nitrososphaerota archaeon]
MKAAAILFHATAAIIFFQLVLGALFVFGFLDSAVHVIDGIIVFGLAVSNLVATVFSKPRFRPTLVTSAVLVALIFLQGFLGFAAFESNAVVVVHFTNAMIIYGLAVLGVFYARAWNKLTVGSVTPS